MAPKSNRKLKNRTLYSVIGIVVILVLAASTYAWIVADPPLPIPDPGHALDTIQGYFVGDISLRDTFAKLQQSPTGGMSCPVANQSIKSIDIEGNVTCETDNLGVTSVTAGDGLTGGGAGPVVPLAVNTGAVLTTGLEIVSDQVRLMDNGCSAGEILKRNAANTGWECVQDGGVINTSALCVKKSDCRSIAGCTGILTEGTCTITAETGSCSASGCSTCFPSYYATCCVCIV